MAGQAAVCLETKLQVEVDEHVCTASTKMCRSKVLKIVFDKCALKPEASVWVRVSQNLQNYAADSTPSAENCGPAGVLSLLAES